MRLYTLLCRSVGPSVTLYFFWVFAVFGLTAPSNDGVTSIKAPAHPHATGLAVYPALYTSLLLPSELLHATGVDVYPALLFSRVLRKSTPRFVHWSIRVCKSVVHILLFYESCNMTSLPLPKWPRGLKYGPCPPAHDWSSDVSGLVCFRNGISLSKDMVHLSFAIAM